MRLLAALLWLTAETTTWSHASTSIYVSRKPTVTIQREWVQELTRNMTTGSSNQQHNPQWKPTQLQRKTTTTKIYIKHSHVSNFNLPTKWRWCFTGFYISKKTVAIHAGHELFNIWQITPLCVRLPVSKDHCVPQLSKLICEFEIGLKILKEL